MVRYFYTWTPLFLVMAIVVLTLPWLGLIALMIVVPLALAAFAFAFVYVPYMVVQAISHRLSAGSASRQTAPALASAARRPTFVS